MKSVWLFGILKFWFFFTTSEGSRQGKEPYTDDSEGLQTVFASVGLISLNNYDESLRKRVKRICS